MKILIGLGLLFSTQLYADEVVTSNYSCTHKDNTLQRQVVIASLYQGCYVMYIKTDEMGNKTSKKLWSAQNSTTYCQSKGIDFVEKTLVTKYGWVCVDNKNNE